MSLYFNVAQMLKEPIGATRGVDVAGEAAISNDGIKSHVSGGVRLTRTDQGVWVEGKVMATMEAECSRCLVSYSHWVTPKLDDLFLPTVDVHTGARLRSLADSEDAFVIDSYHTLDLTEAVRQGAIAAMPLQPLCRTECQGLCPHCGADLNDGPCGCTPEIDARWEPLRQMLGQR